MPGVVIFDMNFGHYMAVLTFFAGIVLKHSSLTLSNVACPSDMCNLATFPGHRILGIFPGHKFFGHKFFWACFMKINFLDMFPAVP